jgi:hypothetical protein
MKEANNTRPFNLEHAKAGAPYSCRDGDVATVLKWDVRNEEYPIVGVVYDTDKLCSWTSAGNHLVNSVPHSLDLVMLPLGYIDGKPVFVGDDLEFDGKLYLAQPSDKNFSTSRWPSPAKVYPKSKMTMDEINNACSALSPDFYCHPLRSIANAALRHAIDAGQVVVPNGLETFRAIGRARASRDMAIAEAVRDACRNKFAGGNADISAATAYGRISNIALANIIAKVQA